MIVEVIGWIGMVLIVLAYFLVSTERLNPKSNAYALMNLLGALFIGINVFVHRAWPTFALEIVWAMIAIVSLFKNLRIQSKR